MTATAYAQVLVRDGGQFSWQALERSAFDGYPALVERLDGSRNDLHADVPRAFSPARGIVAIIAIVIMLVPFIAPGLLIFALRTDSALPQLMITAGALSAVYVLARIAEWIRDTRVRGPISPQSTLLTIVAIPFGGLAAFLAFLVCGRGLVPGDWVWFGLFVAMTLASAISAAASVRRSRAAVSGTQTGGSPLDELRVAIDQLPERDRAAIRADLDRALEVLVTGGVLSADDRAEAQAAPLGGLARRLWALEQSRRTG